MGCWRSICPPEMRRSARAGPLSLVVRIHCQQPAPEAGTCTRNTAAQFDTVHIAKRRERHTRANHAQERTRGLPSTPSSDCVSVSAPPLIAQLRTAPRARHFGVTTAVFVRQTAARSRHDGRQLSRPQAALLSPLPAVQPRGARDGARPASMLLIRSRARRDIDKYAYAISTRLAFAYTI